MTDATPADATELPANRRADLAIADTPTYSPSMNATSFDTLRASKRLKDLGFDERQAEGVAEMLRETREADFASLATKADLANLVTKAELAEFKADLFKWLIPLLIGQAALTATLVELL